MRKNLLYSIAFGCSLTVLLFFSLLLYNSITALNEKSSQAEHSRIIIDKLQRLNLAMMDIETSQRGFLLTHDSTLFDLLIESRDKIPLLLDTLTQLTRDNSDQQRNVILLRDASVRRLQKIQDVLNRVEFMDVPALVTELKEGNRLTNEFRKQLQMLSGQEQILLKARSDSKHSYEKVTPGYFIVIFLIATITALVSFVLLMGELRQRLETQSLLEMRVHTLDRANSELQQISHVTSHDLQEPLRKIRTFSDILVSKFGKDLPEEARTMLQRIDKNANHIRELVGDLSDFSNLANKVEEKSKNIDLNKILLDIQKDLTEVIQEKKARFVISALPVIEGFEKQLYILFREIITNAIKFSREGIEPEIIITGNLLMKDQIKEDRRLGDRSFSVISVYDNGIGFENDYAEKIFVLFQKLHNSNSPYKGKGIGLAVCQRIMANHDGFVTASGRVETGATFQLFFPIN